MRRKIGILTFAFFISCQRSGNPPSEAPPAQPPAAATPSAFFSTVVPGGIANGKIGKWVTYVLDSDFSLISVLGRDNYLQLNPDGVADVNGDGLDEIWCNDVGYEGTSYSLWYLGSNTPPSFKSVEWPYFGL